MAKKYMGFEGVLYWGTAGSTAACDDDVLAALRDRFSGDGAAYLQPFLDDNGVSYEPWSRVGD